MLKQLFFFCAMLLTVPAFAQLDLPTKEDRLYYEGVVDVPGQAQADLYRKGREWFVNTYVDAKEVLQLDDKADGKLMGKGVYKYSFVNGINSSNVQMGFTLNLDAREGKYRYRIYGFNGTNVNVSMLDALATGPSSGPTLRALSYDDIYADLKAGKRVKYNSKILQGMDEQVKGIIASLQKAMSTPAGKDEF